MTAQARKILQEALSLAEEDRQRLAEALLDSISGEIEESWNKEALRRAEAFERGEVQAIDGEQAIDSLRSRLSVARSV